MNRKDGVAVRILALTVGDAQTGSTKYRIRQYAPLLERWGAELQWVQRKEVSRAAVDLAARADVVFNQKSLFSCRLSKRMIQRCGRTIFDFDDAIYTRPGKRYGWLTRQRLLQRLHLWLRRSDLVISANHYLAQYALRYTSRVRVLPMSLNLDIWKPVARPVRREVNVGWIGSPGNLSHLERIEPVLACVMRRAPNVRLAVFSGQRPNLWIPFSYQPFQAEQEARFVQQLDIGLLPLRDGGHARGKSPIKAIQYLACAVPVVGEVFGATGEILNQHNSIAVQREEEWIDALIRLIQDRALAETLGVNGRKQVERFHDMRRNCEKLWDYLNDEESGRRNLDSH